MPHPSPPGAPRRSPLHDRHVALGAAFTDFAGWQMPVRYASDLAEHHAVREAAGIFDISHMAQFWVHGGRSAAFLDYALSGPIATVAIGRAKYTLMLTEDGGVIDDLIVYRTGPEYFLVIANAGNRDAVAREFEARLDAWGRIQPFLDGPLESESFAVVSGGGRPRIEDITDASALIAVQGPRAEEILTAVAGLEVTGVPLAQVRGYAFTEARFAGESVLIARTGYTGEDGFELLVPVRAAGALWDEVLAAGSGFGLVPAGLAARDTLRLEAGMPLYGHELSRMTAPAQAGLGWAVAAGKAEFVGKDGALAADADARVLVGLACEGRRAGRTGYPVVLPAATDADSPVVVGEVTSGALSPTLGHPIALAYVDPAHAAPGTALAIDVRGTLVPASVTTLPFYRRKK